ncbi:succinate dehydrogenase, hydrophobic membrane anchor protein [Novosphingopyxis sp. YJ-S2-01]|uniref:succinate dehydrogenase, hydrophobic membrane anchor protein n=1 Tax=Novosphingopyxis sp. YJ-S2-01 TaxID=2794021 RepID=UPI000C57AA3D|nr:succinate dehydrogenase, hydrophobic membrane anchor protein [Novosphingopyxis sp. YJ-S2-01]MAC12379.1 succinate dehydrogenase, hydrophobic membrane anchor protein [Sphingorhabdus sp.]MBH9537470.1 succinate dehydrogenase, hydrophobic membrane anchor protein [Novosphingopyxis sp. YJ-S2-01]
MGNGTELGRVRGLGSAKEGAHHWIGQRLTALANLLLLLWFVGSLLALPSLGYQTVATWLSSPLVAVPMILLVISTCWHLRLGLQVFIEDYAHEPSAKLPLLIILNFYAIAAAALGTFAVLKLAFTGAAA